MESRDGLVLVADRRGDAERPPALPGGKLEAGESFETCAVRELAEETGLVLEPASVRTFGCAFVPGAPVGWVVVGVAGRIDADVAEIEPRELEPEKVGAFRWIDPAAPPAKLFPASRALLAAYVRDSVA